MSEIFKCSRGFLVKKDKNGRYLPFFIKVRSQDIIYDKKPTETKVSIDDDWTCKIENDTYFDGTLNAQINNMNFSLNSSRNEFIGEFDIPYSVIYVNSFCVNSNIISYSDVLTESTINVVPVNTGGRISKIRVYIRNTNQTYPSTWSTNLDFIESTVNIRVSGVIGMI